jgi:hypothetical protein
MPSELAALGVFEEQGSMHLDVHQASTDMAMLAQVEEFEESKVQSVIQ